MKRSLYAQDTGVRAILAGRPALHLRVVEVRAHAGLVVEEPGVDELGRVLRIRVGAVEDPRERVVQHGVGHVLKVADVVHLARVGVELAVADDVRAFRPYYSRARGYVGVAEEGCTNLPPGSVRWCCRHWSSLATSW